MLAGEYSVGYRNARLWDGVAHSRSLPPTTAKWDIPLPRSAKWERTLGGMPRTCRARRAHTSRSKSQSRTAPPAASSHVTNVGLRCLSLRRYNAARDAIEHTTRATVRTLRAYATYHPLPRLPRRLGYRREELRDCQPRDQRVVERRAPADRAASQPRHRRCESCAPLQYAG